MPSWWTSILIKELWGYIIHNCIVSPMVSLCIQAFYSQLPSSFVHWVWPWDLLALANGTMTHKKAHKVLVPLCPSPGVVIAVRTCPDRPAGGCGKQQCLFPCGVFLTKDANTLYHNACPSCPFIISPSCPSMHYTLSPGNHYFINVTCTS